MSRKKLAWTSTVVALHTAIPGPRCMQLWCKGYGGYGYVNRCTCANGASAMNRIPGFGSRALNCLVWFGLWCVKRTVRSRKNAMKWWCEWDCVRFMFMYGCVPSQLRQPASDDGLMDQCWCRVTPYGCRGWEASMWKKVDLGPLKIDDRDSQTRDYWRKQSVKFSDEQKSRRERGRAKLQPERCLFCTHPSPCAVTPVSVGWQCGPINARITTPHHCTASQLYLQFGVFQSLEWTLLDWATFQKMRANTSCRSVKGWLAWLMKQ